MTARCRHCGRRTKTKLDLCPNCAAALDRKRARDKEWAQNRAAERRARMGPTPARS